MAKTKTTRIDDGEEFLQALLQVSGLGFSNYGLRFRFFEPMALDTAKTTWVCRIAQHCIGCKVPLGRQSRV